MSARTGLGWDSHRLVAGRPLILGGVTFPDAELGLDGHSDADVLTHAVMDALLGAAGLGDIGVHFPDTDGRYEGADSIALLGEVRALVEAQGLRAVHVDTTVLMERPSSAPTATPCASAWRPRSGWPRRPSTSRPAPARAWASSAAARASARSPSPPSSPASRTSGCAPPQHGSSAASRSPG